MTLDARHVGLSYGPFSYDVGVEKLREFAFTVGGTVPSTGFGIGAPEGLHPWLHDKEAAASSPHKRLMAMPNFAVVYAIQPFGAACTDPRLGIDLMMLVHGEQSFEFFAPVFAGDTITTTGAVTKAYSKAGKDFLVVESKSVNQHGQPVCTGVWTAVIRG